MGIGQEELETILRPSCFSSHHPCLDVASLHRIDDYLCQYQGRKQETKALLPQRSHFENLTQNCMVLNVFGLDQKVKRASRGRAI